MLVEHLLEGMMKRSDPHISGDGAVPKEPSVKQKTRESRFAKLAKLAGVSEDKVRDSWNAHSAQVDKNNKHAWAIITSRVKKDLGL